MSPGKHRGVESRHQNTATFVISATSGFSLMQRIYTGEYLNTWNISELSKTALKKLLGPLTTEELNYGADLY